VLIFFLFLKRSKIDISEIFRLLVRLSRRIEAEQENDQNDASLLSEAA